jgi:hypothetical protein
MSSLSFLGNATSYLSIPSTPDLNFRTNDFTIEWYQYQTDTNSFPRIFQIGSYGNRSISIGVSIEGGTFYFWSNNAATVVTSLTNSQYKNKWTHFAISRSQGVTKIFMDGTSIFSRADTTDYNSTAPLILSNESNRTNISAFGGYMAYFSWVNGTALYTTNFTVSPNYTENTPNTKLLINAYNNAGTLGNSVVNVNVGTYPITPPGFTTVPPTPPPPTPPPQTPSNQQSVPRMSSLFSNNSMVYYKKGSLASCGVGTVRNSNVKFRKI